jgi:D-cysteine desulfhydrase family pyridoxal phosphate-dependent enzyme
MRLSSLPRFPLAQLPTPLMPAQNLSAELGGPEILIKRDDLTGLALGGNKTRKLEYLVADAQLKGATHLITTGSVQSNHCRQTAAAAKIAGLNCVLVMSATSETPEIQGNLLLDTILGAETVIITDRDQRYPTMDRVADELRGQGAVPYVIPVGGSNPVGSSAYVAATYELIGQLIEQGKRPTRLYSAGGGPGGTFSGLCLGAKLAGAPYQPIGISIEGPNDRVQAACVELANKTAEYLEADVTITEADVRVDDRYTGPGYGIATDECLEAIRLFARTEGIFLDPVYTGKVAAGLIDHVRKGEIGPDETVVFLHSGGAPALFAMTDVVLPAMQGDRA